MALRLGVASGVNEPLQFRDLEAMAITGASATMTTDFQGTHCLQVSSQKMLTASACIYVL